MPRKKRILVAGGIYHVYPRATGGGLMFVDGADRDRQIAMLATAVERYGWRVHFVTVLGTHWHMLLTTPQPNLSTGMQYLLGVYCRSFNRRHGRFGHLTADRYGARLVESQLHGSALVPYLALNCVRAGLSARPEDWAWSTYASLIGLAPQWSFIRPDWLLDQFDHDAGRARTYLRALVDEQLLYVA